MKINKNHYHVAIAFITITLLFGGFQYIYSIFADSNRSSGNILFQAISLPLYLLAMCHLFLNKSFNFRSFCANNAPLVILIAFSFASVLWSIEPNTSFRRSVALVLSSFFCLYLAVFFSIEKALKIIWVSALFVSFVGILASFIPGVGTDPANWQYPDAWRGLTGNKTDFGRILALTAILTFYLYSKKAISLNYSLLIFVFIFVALVKSEATTPLVLSVLSLLWMNIFFKMVGIKSSVKSYISVGAMFFIVYLASVLVIDNFNTVTEQLGKDTTLTGRTSIWEYALIASEDFRNFGAGYRAFWIDRITYDFYYYNPYWGEELMNNGHNGYIDVLVELGVVGVIILMIFIFSYFRRMFLYSDSCIEKEQALGITLMIFYLFYSVTEQTTLEQSEFLWMTLTFLYFAVRRKSYA